MRSSGAGALFALLTAAGAPGCASAVPAGERPTGKATSAIQGGIDDPTDTFAVGVCRGAPGSCRLTCSGTLIAPNLVVTARHCVDEGGSAPIDCATATWGARQGPPSSYAITTDRSMHQSASGWHAVAQIVTPDRASVCGGDLALLVLGDVLSPAEALPATPNVSIAITDHARLEPVVTTIGYGLTTAVQAEGGVAAGGFRRSRQDVPVQCVVNDPDPTLTCSAQGSILAAGEFVTGGGDCEGDSGGGAFEQSSFAAGVPLSLGVLSRGGVDPEDPTRCAGGTYTRLDAWRDFLVHAAQAAAQAGNYTPPAWTLGGSPPADAGPTGLLSATGGCELSRTPLAPGSAPGIFLPIGLVGGALCRRRRSLPSGNCRKSDRPGRAKR